MEFQEKLQLESHKLLLQRCWWLAYCQVAWEVALYPSLLINFRGEAKELMSHYKYKHTSREVHNPIYLDLGDAEPLAFGGPLFLTLFSVETLGTFEFVSFSAQR